MVAASVVVVAASVVVVAASVVVVAASVVVVAASVVVVVDSPPPSGAQMCDRLNSSVSGLAGVATT
ncbi:unannotated protein [freshwater metagenome]|uniref:Unannotated protein n=1 Tax=freshwater metagenome TaxID=449393 RepID=A0A6J7C5E5_9ZZZZ